MEKRWQSLKAYVDEEAHSIRQSEKVNSRAVFLPSFGNRYLKAFNLPWVDILLSLFSGLAIDYTL